MSESLRDQLLKSGLGTKLKAQAPAAPVARAKQNFRRPPSKPHPGSAPERGTQGHANTSPPREKNQRAPGTHTEPNLAHAYALRAKQEKDERNQAQRDAELAAQHKRERNKKLADLLNGKGVNAADADTPRHFPHGNKIRRVYCTPAQLAELNRGELAVVQLAGRYLLVSREVALGVQAIEERALVLLCDPNAPPEDDVPPDLVW